MNKLLTLASIWLILFIKSYGQTTGETRIVVDKFFDLRKSAENYFGDANLWPFILQYNNLEKTSVPKVGAKLILPYALVKRALNKIKEADSNIQRAVEIGAKVLAEELLNTSYAYYKTAIDSKNSFEFENSFKNAEEANDKANQAFKQTQEIREKTIDAIISFKKGTVQKMYPSVLKWRNAEIYENMKENDWARTLTLSLAKITFHDLSQIKLNENSQAIIQKSRLDALSLKSITKVKLEKGDAYATLLNNPKRKFDLDIKGVKTKINSKYFWVEKEKTGAKIANYNGEIKIDVKDSSVVVEKNQGSFVPTDGFPTKPKNLLEPPKLIEPSNAQSIFNSVCKFSWEENKKAKEYWLQISNDDDFKQIFLLKKRLDVGYTEITNLINGIYYWRVCAIDSLGLPGPFSYAQAIIVSMDGNKPFLSIDSPTQNYSTCENKVIVRGRIEGESNLFVNGKSVVVDSGRFNYNVNLKNGENKINVVVKTNSGGLNEITRTVYYEENPFIKVSDEKLGELKDNTEILSNDANYNLNLTILPFAKIEIGEKGKDDYHILFTDSLGRAAVSLNQKNIKDYHKIRITSQAGHTRFLRIKITLDMEAPLIALHVPDNISTNNKDFLFTGIIHGASQVIINGRKVDLDENDQFNENVQLKGGINTLDVKASDAAGNESSKKLTVVFDNQPPKLVSYELNSLNDEKSIYRIVIKASDETTLKNSAEIELLLSGKIQKEFLEYNKSQNAYVGEIANQSKLKVVLHSVKLSDYLDNQKIFYTR